MKKFEVLLYLKKWWILIVAVSFFAGIFIMRYAVNNQVYTANTVIKYNYEKAKEGLTPGDEKLDVSEIFSATVVKETIEELGLNASVDSIRSAGNVKEIIPDEIKRSQEAKIDNGDDYEEYHPVEYAVEFSTDSAHGSEYARGVLDELLSNYFVEFSEKYVSRSTIPNNTKDVMSEDYDYIEQAEIINNSVEEIINQLGERQGQNPEFCSAATGLTLSDLLEQYQYISNVKVPYLFSEILNGKVTKDKEILIKKYEERIEGYNLSGKTDAAKVDSVLEIIDSYGNKNKEGSLYYNEDSTDEGNKLNGNILGEVYEDNENRTEEGERIVVDRTTVYDQLLEDYVSLRTSKSNKEIDAAYCQYIIENFQEVDSQKTNTLIAGEKVIREIEGLLSELDDMYADLSVTLEEYNEYIGAQNVVMLSSTSVSERINIKLYIFLGVGLFFVVGCLGAVLLGRLQDFVEYFFYMDSKLRLPNRNACDTFIKNHSEKVLKNSYACIIMELTNLNRINTLKGREEGDRLLKAFAQFAKNSSETLGKIYYNGGSQFIGFFEKCTREELESCADYMLRLVKDYNAENAERKMECTIGKAESRSDNIYRIRGLLSKALKDRKEQEV